MFFVLGALLAGIGQSLMLMNRPSAAQCIVLALRQDMSVYPEYRWYLLGYWMRVAGAMIVVGSVLVMAWRALP